VIDREPFSFQRLVEQRTAPAPLLLRQFAQIDLAIAEGSTSITIAVRLDVTGSTITIMFILNGQASVDVLGGLASASRTSASRSRPDTGPRGT